MTTFQEDTALCAVCKTQNPTIVLCSTNRFGSPDLDNRPPQMKRGTMAYWVQACQECGYVAYDIQKSVDPIEQEIIYSQAYQELRTNPAYPDLATRFLRQAFLAECREDWFEAGQATLHAAWNCDDAGESHVESARQCRLRANELFGRADRAGSLQEAQVGYWNMLRTDLLRRANDSVAAAELCRTTLQNNPDEMIARLLRFEQARIDAGDTNCYTVAEAFDAVE